MAHLDKRMDPAKEPKPQDKRPVKDGASGNSAAAAPDARAARATGRRGADPDVPRHKPPKHA